MMSSLPAEHRISVREIYDYELIYVTAGKARITIGSKEYICTKNNAVLLRPGVPHEFEVIGEDEFVQPHIHFDLIYGENSEKTPISFKSRQAMSREELRLISSDILEPHIPAVFIPKAPDEFSRLLFDIIAIFEKRDHGYELACKIKLLELMSLIFSQFETASETYTGASSDSVVIVKNYIDSNYLTPITLEGLQKQFFVNKYTLIRNYKKLYKMSPISHYRNLRAEYAKSLLGKTNVPIKAIADELGYQDICSFSRFFHMQTGMAPMDYREARRKLDNK